MCCRADSEFTDPSVGALLAMRCLALLDSLAPLCWQGHALWPDAISPALAEAWGNEVLTTSLTELVWAEAIGACAQIRPDLCDGASLRTDARQMLAVQSSVGFGGGLRRLRHQFNSLLPCANPLLAGRFVARFGDLLLVLDAGAGNAGPTRPMDVETATFITARPEIRLDSDVAALTDSDTTLPGALAQSRMYALLEGLVSSQALPALAGCAFRGTLGGQLRSSRPLSGTVEPAGYRRTNQRDASHRPADGIEFELGQLREGKTGRADLAYRLGQETATGTGPAALAGLAKTAALG